jgi:AcrR family transcriptional regulator
MGRWQPDSAGRLYEAALALFAEQGFEETTAAEIAARAGLTERTFFRHYGDKREVLFSGSAILGEHIVSAVRTSPAADSALDAVARGLAAAARLLDEIGQDRARQRYAVIAANPELKERELAKIANYADGVADALRARGVSQTHATIAAEAGMTVFRVAYERWADEPDDRDLTTITHEAIAELRALATGD